MIPRGMASAMYQAAPAALRHARGMPVASGIGGGSQ